tara:strand:- start:113 stop:853 length:741 start_codon:yes stop_codon:yes gene_type:complete
MSEENKLKDVLADASKLKSNSLTTATMDAIKLAEANGLSVEELVGQLGVDLNAPESKIPVDDTSDIADEEKINEFIKLQSKAPIPGQSLTNSPESPYPWEKETQFANPKDAIEDLYGRLLQPEATAAIAKSLKAGATVSDITTTILYTDFTEGKYNPDVLMLLMEPTMYLVMGIGEKANIDYELGEGEDEENIKTDSEETSFQLGNAINSMKQTAASKPIREETVPENLREKLKSVEVPSLLERKI